jgi:CheY-like chemotaxis protein
VAKTLLAVDDSVTMRKVLEITFSGEDFRVITADGSQSAMAKLSENANVNVFVVDTVLGGEDGYALAKQLRQRNPGAPIIMLASRYSPYDQGRGRDAGADDWADKPFDTQQLLDKVRKVILAKEATGASAGPAAAPAPPPQPIAAAPAPQPGFRQPAAPMAGAGGGLGRGTQPSLGGSVPRTGTLVFGEGGQSPAPPPAAAAAPPRPVAAQPPPAAAPPAPSATAAAAGGGGGGGAVGAAINGQLAGKLGDLGLSPQQAEAVLALSREVVERVVWEVVPQLAETMIKEEIARLTKE